MLFRSLLQLFFMNKTTIAIVVVLSFAFLSLFAASQLDELLPIVEVERIQSFISANMDLIEEETCTTTFYEEDEPIMDTCTSYRNYTSCLNTTGPNTACSAEQSISNYSCQTGTVTSTKNRTECVPNKEFIIEITEGEATLRKKIDYSDWGPCVQEIQGNCLVVTCVSYYDGAHNGEFTDCNGGKSCQRFEICDGEVTTTYKNSRDDFTSDDPTFYLGRLQVQEVE